MSLLVKQSEDGSRIEINRSGIRKETVSWVWAQYLLLKVLYQEDQNPNISNLNWFLGFGLQDFLLKLVLQFNQRILR